MPKLPKISAVLQKKHSGETVISLNGKIVSIGKNSLEAVNKAKKSIPDIENKEFLVSRIHPKYLVA